MSPGRMPIPPIGRRPSSGDVDLGTGMYLMAGVHSSDWLSEAVSAGVSEAATVVDALAEETRSTEDEETASDNGNIAEDKGTSDEDG